MVCGPFQLTIGIVFFLNLWVSIKSCFIVWAIILFIESHSSMPSFEASRFVPEAVRVEAQESKPAKQLSKQELIAYRKWKHDIPSDLRFLVEAHLLGKKTRIGKTDMPSVVEFYQGMQLLLDDPQMDPSTLDVSPIVQKQVSALQKLKIGEDRVNVFAALSDTEIGFDVKANYVQSKLLPRLQFLRVHDRRLMEQEQTKQGETSVIGEDEEEEYSPHRAPQEESEGLPSEAVATVAPFFGGLHMDSVYDQYDPARLTWKKSVRHFHELPVQRLDEERKRVYRSSVKNGKGAIKLARGWGVHRESLQSASLDVAATKIEHDQDGVIRLRSDQDGIFSIQIAPSEDAIGLAPTEGEFPIVPDAFPDELMQTAQAVLARRLSPSITAKRIASLIHKHLEYDMDAKWEAVYKADPSRYFQAIWENKKAKCDEANTLLVRLLTKLGMHARYVQGHSVRVKSPTGEAMLLESNRHAWAFVWDSEAEQWGRLDATPAGDPNVDQEEQQADLGEGDYGDQEAELMSQEELDKRMEELQKEEDEHRTREDPVLAYAKEAKCTPEEARAALQKIESLRRQYARVLADADRQWQTLIRENTREQIVDRGPVSLSKMDDIDPDELVSGYIEVLAGEKDPLIGEREEREQKKEKWFGGYEVYVAVDMSESMDETIGGVKKIDAQRDMVFLFVDSCMSAAVSARQKSHQLKALMPVKVSVTVFGAQTEIVLSLTEEWGPKEQIKLYHALDAGAGGSTPDHVALKLIEEQIARSLAAQDEMRKQKPALRKHDWKMRRFVIATADGGSDNDKLVKQANDRLKQQGIPVDLFLIAPEDDEHLQTFAKTNYQSVTPISDVSELAEKGLKRLTERIRAAYASPRSS